MMHRLSVRHMLGVPEPAQARLGPDLSRLFHLPIRIIVSHEYHTKFSSHIPDNFYVSDDVRPVDRSLPGSDVHWCYHGDFTVSHHYV